MVPLQPLPYPWFAQTSEWNIESHRVTQVAENRQSARPDAASFEAEVSQTRQVIGAFLAFPALRWELKLSCSVVPRFLVAAPLKMVLPQKGSFFSFFFFSRVTEQLSKVSFQLSTAGEGTPYKEFVGINGFVPVACTTQPLNPISAPMFQSRFNGPKYGHEARFMHLMRAMVRHLLRSRTLCGFREMSSPVSKSYIYIYNLYIYIYMSFFGGWGGGVGLL